LFFIVLNEVVDVDEAYLEQKEQNKKISNIHKN